MFIISLLKPRNSNKTNINVSIQLHSEFSWRNWILNSVEFLTDFWISLASSIFILKILVILNLGSFSFIYCHCLKCLLKGRRVAEKSMDFWADDCRRSRFPVCVFMYVTTKGYLCQRRTCVQMPQFMHNRPIS